jgi:hypothetical protein
MTIAADQGGSIQQHMVAFKAIVLVPVCSMLLCLAFTVAGCEVFATKELNARRLRGETNGDMAPVLSNLPQTAEPQSGLRSVSFARDNGDAV